VSTDSVVDPAVLYNHGASGARIIHLDDIASEVQGRFSPSFWGFLRTKCENVAQFTSWLLTSMFHVGLSDILRGLAPQCVSGAPLHAPRITQHRPASPWLHAVSLFY